MLCLVDTHDRAKKTFVFIAAMISGESSLVAELVCDSCYTLNLQGREPRIKASGDDRPRLTILSERKRCEP